MKTKDTYMKYTWLTVSKESMGKEHQCIITHEKNKEGVDQEILFPSISKGVTNKWLLLETLRLQAMNTSAYYTYVLLLLKSVIYSVIITYFLLGRPALCDWKDFAPWVHFSSLAIVTKRSTEDIEDLPF
uniref:Immunoglobulin C1-set domain-containing protein n=1 Tax=Suricata suricatta TaxID=37032 RepID=A0A673U4Z4_SURSU